MGAPGPIADLPRSGRAGSARRPARGAPRLGSRRWPAVCVVALTLAWGSRAVAQTASGAAPSPPVGGEAAPGWERGLGYRVTLALTQARDDLLAPLRWQGPTLGVGGWWTWGSAPAVNAVTLEIPFSVLSNRFGHRGYALSPLLTYGHLRRLTGGDAPTAAWVGGRLRGDLFNGFYESWDDEHLYWTTVYSLGPTVAWRGRVRGIAVWGGADLPLVAAVSRPPADRMNQIDRLTRISGHLVDTHKDPSLAVFPAYAALHLTLGVVARVAGSLITLSYEVHGSTYDAPSRVSLLRHGVTVARRPHP